MRVFRLTVFLVALMLTGPLQAQTPPSQPSDSNSAAAQPAPTASPTETPSVPAPPPAQNPSAPPNQVSPVKPPTPAVAQPKTSPRPSPVVPPGPAQPRPTEPTLRAKPALPPTTVPKPVEPSSPPTETGKKEMRRLKRILAIFEIESNGQPLGTIKAQLFIDKAPKTVENFIALSEGTQQFKEFDEHKGKLGSLVSRKFYDGLKFHRVVPKYVIQGGCPFGTGRGGPGYTIPDEFHPDLHHDSMGVLSMANTEKKDSAGSQFFITLAPLKHLDRKNAIFGKVVEGLDVVKKMGEVKRNPMTDQPLQPLILKTVSIVREYAN